MHMPPGDNVGDMLPITLGLGKQPEMGQGVAMEHQGRSATQHRWVA
jgi:hypothetical protein